MQQKKLFRNLFVILAGLFVVYLGGCYYLAKDYVSPKRRISKKPPAPILDTKIEGPGYQLPVWISPALAKGEPTSKNVYVFIHGYKSARERWLPVVEQMLEKEQEFVTVAMRGHDTNPIGCSSFGVHETKEVLSAVKWVKGQYIEKKPNIILVGLSLGTSSCWRAAQQDPSIAAVVADSGFANLSEATTLWLEREFTGASTILKPMIWMAEAMCGVKTKDVVPEKTALAWKGKTALVIHGDSDDLFGTTHAERLAKAAGCEMWIVKGAGHGDCEKVNMTGYIEKLLEIGKRVNNSLNS